MSSPRPTFIALAFALAAGALLVSGCRTEAPEAAADAPAAKHHYSPFIVAVKGEVPFDVVTFKDVGIAPAAKPGPFLYEAVSQGLALSLSKSRQDLRVQAEAAYDERAADPGAHLACEGYHIYADLWTDPEATSWGYSLWSGCGESSRFAHESLPLTQDGDAVSVETLTEHIATQLEAAVRSSCFRTSC